MNLQLDNTDLIIKQNSIFNYWIEWMKLDLFNFKLIRNNNIKDNFLKYLEKEEEYELCQILVNKNL